ncbi:MAG: hypothetical protein GTO02_21420 [Candidatus Dadabacteria bacterium]|nr:hypothetical protein [Candidatus Dadabacteria bacterium]NIQ16844.1 hypothetical protein [Candidatus Dadabacteria bacterium]
MNESKKILNFLPVLFGLFLFPMILIAGGDVEEEVAEPEKNEEEVEVIIISENPQRNYCKLHWNEYYRSENTNITVSTRGKYDEIVVFTCHECNSEEHFVEPFLNTRTYGMTGIERIRACGFLKAVFKGGKGIQEIERDIN